MALLIEPVQPSENDAVIALLEQGNLLTEDLPAGLPGFMVAKYEGIPIGVAGIEAFGQVGLLRSVVVTTTQQGKGIGTKLIEHLLVNTDDLQELYLITTTANDYFVRFGFKPISRDLVPDSIQQTKQFSGLCPSSAVIMKRAIV